MIVTTVGQRLAEAEAALHKLRIGKAVVVLEVDGRKVHYRPSTIEELLAYRDELLIEASGVVPCRRGRAIGILFG